MGYIPIEQLTPGMIFDSDIKDINGRLLFSRGHKFDPNYMRILKIWGIAEVSVEGNTESETVSETPLDNEQIKKYTENAKQVFRHVDLEHPAMKEIFLFSVLYRSQNNKWYSDESSTLNDVRTNQPVENVRKKIDQSQLKLPESPSIISDLNEIIAYPYSSAHDIAEVVNKSPSLATLLLRIVNSAFYGFPSRIDSIPWAVTLIGSKEISNLALGISIMQTFKDIPKEIIDMRSFLTHSFACGIISRILGAHKNMLHTEQLFVSGLLHDIGRLIVYKYFPEQGLSLLKEAIASGQLLYLMEREYWGSRHTYIGKSLLQKWNLPATLHDNVVYHHNPSKSPDPDKATIVHLADIIAIGMGMGSSGEKLVPILDETAWKDLRVSPSIFNGIIRQAVHQLTSLESFF